MASAKRFVLTLSFFALSAAAGGDANASGGGDGHGGGAPHINWTDVSYGDKDHEGGKLEAGEEPMAPPLVFALINFAIFAGLLYWKAGPALSKYLANRHETIKNALEEAAKLQEQAKKKMAEYSDRISDVDAEVKALIEQIKKDSEAERERIVADAKAQAERMRKEAEARIEAEFAIARRQLEAEVIAKAVAAAEIKLANATSPSDHTNLFDNFISGLKSAPTQKEQA